jgi:signal peptidase II
LGGSLGNLYDRIQYGYVIDYIDFRFFPVFNFGDVAINLGVFLIILDILIKRKKCTR